MVRRTLVPERAQGLVRQNQGAEEFLRIVREKRRPLPSPGHGLSLAMLRREQGATPRHGDTSGQAVCQYYVLTPCGPSSPVLPPAELLLWSTLLSAGTRSSGLDKEEERRSC